MMLICKMAHGSCPDGFNICCGVCEYKDKCDSCCAEARKGNHMTCSDSEVVNEGLVSFQAAVPDVIRNMTDLIQMKKQLEEREKVLKQELLAAMEKFGVKSFDTDLIKLTYVAPTTKTAIDSARLKKELPDIAKRYTKTSNVSAYVKIEVK